MPEIRCSYDFFLIQTESDGTPILPGPLSKRYVVTDQVLGQGSFALVKLAKDKDTGEERALKIIAKRPLKEGNEMMLKEEIAILGRVEHPHIIKMWDLYETKEAVFIVTDLCRGGELFDRLVEKVHYDELDARHITRQIFEGIAYLHDHDIIHRDLKPENILLREKEEPSEIVISDFGLSKFIPEDGHLLMTACGSPQYVAPEVLLGKGYDAAVDVWSGGVIAYCLLAGYTPFYGDDQPSLFKHILSMEVVFEPEYWSEVSSTAKDFIVKCLCPPQRRLTAHEALKHPYLADLPSLDCHKDKRGCCLKKSAMRNQASTKSSKFSRAVTAVEAANYLQHLHDLRNTHTDIPAEKKSSLTRLASHISQLSGHANDGPDQNKSADTLKPKTSNERGDSGASFDLVVMMAHIPPPKLSGTAAVAQEAEATQHGENPVSVQKHEEQSAQNPAESPSQSVSEFSDSTTTPTSEQRKSSISRPRPRRQQSSRSSRSGKNKTNKTLDTLLDQYRSNVLPSTARTDPTTPMSQPEGMSLGKAWRYVPLLVNTGISIGSAIASHAFYGPPKKSWGIEMSVFTKIMRDTASYTEFATVSGLQQFFELSNFLPVPKDGLITPVTYKVKKRGLRGLLKEADEAEDGNRELTGEWVVGKQTWRRLQSEWRNGKPSNKERVILYIHGGAYFVMSAVTHRPLTISLSKYTECRLFAINYRLAPDCQFPGPLHDVVSSWFRLVEDLGIPPQNIVLGGDSAGGGLVMALLLYLRDNDYELPSGAILFSPWVDLTLSCDSWETNSAYDYLPMPVPGNHMNPVKAYLGDNIDKYLTHPYASPLFGDLRGLPPLLIQCGDAEVLRDEITLLAHKASLAGVAVRHELYEDCVHVFPAFLFLDASRKALQSARHFVRTALDKRGQRKAEVKSRSRDEINDEMRKGMENEKGEFVEPLTGEKYGSKSKSSSHHDKEADRSDEDWRDFEEEQSSQMQRSKSQPGDNVFSGDLRKHVKSHTLDTFAPSQPRTTRISAPTSPAAAPPTRSGRNRSGSALPGSLSHITLEQARSRAQAGMLYQESREAPQLSKFHTLHKPLQPRMRRSASNATINNLVQSWTQSQQGSGLNTRVFTPGVANNDPDDNSR